MGSRKAVAAFTFLAVVVAACSSADRVSAPTDSTPPERKPSPSLEVSTVSEGGVVYYVAEIRDMRLATARALGSRQTTLQIAEVAGAELAVNADFYDYRLDGIVIRGGSTYVNVPTRHGLAINADGTLALYDERTTTAGKLVAGGVLETLSFGPWLINDGVPLTEQQMRAGNAAFSVDAYSSRHPRTAVCMVAPYHYLVVVVDGRSSASRGMTLVELADMMKRRGCVEAYNLDGGGSSTMVYRGRVVNVPSDGNQRPTSDALTVVPID